MKKDVLLSFLSKIGVAISSLILGILLARFFGPQKKGIIDIYLNNFLIVAPLAQFGMLEAIPYLQKKLKKNKSDINNSSFRIALMSSFFYIILFAVLCALSSNNDFLLIGMLILAIPFSVIKYFSLSHFIIEKDFTSYNIQLTIESYSIILILILFILLNLINEFYYFTAFLLSKVFSFIYVYKKIDQETNSYAISNFKFVKQDFELIKYGFQFALPLFIMMLNYKVDIFILDFYVDKDLVSIYALGVSLVSIIWIFPQVFNTVLFAHKLENIKDSNYALHLLKKVFYFLIILIFVSFIPFCFFGKTIVNMIYGKEFIDVYDVILYSLPGIYMFTFFKMLNGYLKAMGHQNYISIIFTFAVILNVMLNIYFIPLMGIKGAAIASSISYTFGSLVFLVIYYNKLIK